LVGVRGGLDSECAFPVSGSPPKYTRGRFVMLEMIGAVRFRTWVIARNDSEVRCRHTAFLCGSGFSPRESQEIAGKGTAG